jgi:(2Fe-2S) ferredoxin
MTHRVVLCIGKNCNATGAADACFQRLRQDLGYPNPFAPVGDIKWEVANCLNRCEEGPNLVIYPEGRWWHDLTPEALEEFIAQEITPRLGN